MRHDYYFLFAYARQLRHMIIAALQMMLLVCVPYAAAI